MSGCYGNDPYDKWLEAQQDKYWESAFADDEEEVDEDEQEEEVLMRDGFSAPDTWSRVPSENKEIEL